MGEVSKKYHIITRSNNSFSFFYSMEHSLDYYSIAMNENKGYALSNLAMKCALGISEDRETLLSYITTEFDLFKLMMSRFLTNGEIMSKFHKIHKIEYIEELFRADILSHAEKMTAVKELGRQNNSNHVYILLHTENEFTEEEVDYLHRYITIMNDFSDDQFVDLIDNNYLQIFSKDDFKDILKSFIKAYPALYALKYKNAFGKILYKHAIKEVCKQPTVALNVLLVMDDDNLDKMVLNAVLKAKEEDYNEIISMIYDPEIVSFVTSKEKRQLIYILLDKFYGNSYMDTKTIKAMETYMKQYNTDVFEDFIASKRVMEILEKAE